MTKKKKTNDANIKHRYKHGYTEVQLQAMIKRSTIKVGELNNEKVVSDNGTEESRNN